MFSGKALSCIAACFCLGSNRNTRMLTAAFLLVRRFQKPCSGSGFLSSLWLLNFEPCSGCIHCAGELHPNVNLDNPEEGLDLNVLVGPHRQKHTVDVALSNSFGFGGHNSSILFSAFRD